MTEYVTLDEIKSQVLVDKWFTDDDDYLISLRSAAEDIVSNEIDMSLNQAAAQNNGVLPNGLKMAILLIVDYFYSSNRGSEQTDIPPAFLHLCAIYRNWGSTR